jgi:hypothetical protein
VIVLLHVATGGALGALTPSRLAALALGPPLHLACDWVPHADIRDRRFEVRSGLFGLTLLALCRGPLDPATLGAASASAPDLEHVFPRLRPRGRKLFHGGRGWHRTGGFRADVQLVLAGAIIGLLVKPPRQAWQTQGRWIRKSVRLLTSSPDTHRRFRSLDRRDEPALEVRSASSA